MTVRFPYVDVEPLEIEEDLDVDFFDLPSGEGTGPDARDARVSSAREMMTISDEEFAAAEERTVSIVNDALHDPIGTERIARLARNDGTVLIVVDDNSRPTPVSLFVHCVLEELYEAGVSDHRITFMMALGTHRPMTADEMAEKLGEDVVKRYACLNHRVGKARSTGVSRRHRAGRAGVDQQEGR